tara:strand:+ start:1694 stop:2470 length:777 start_codon:yes stop_codon:yes gene_type:complete
LNKNLIIVLAHQDDEFCLFNRIINFKDKKNIYIFYMTSGMNVNSNKKYLNHRDLESIKVLRKLGISKKNIFFLGRKLSINNNQLHNNLQKAFPELVKKLKKINGTKIGYTHSLEGGHEDHDACYYLVKIANYKYKFFQSCFQFPAYNGEKLPYIFFRVFSPIKKNGKIYQLKYKFIDRFKFIYLLFFYKSQFKIWIGLYPFIIFKYLFYKSDSVQEIRINNTIRRPHIGKLLYEKRKFCKYKIFNQKIIKFVNSHKIN